MDRDGASQEMGCHKPSQAELKVIEGYYGRRGEDVEDILEGITEVIQHGGSIRCPHCQKVFGILGATPKGTVRKCSHCGQEVIVKGHYVLHIYSIEAVKP